MSGLSEVAGAVVEAIHTGDIAGLRQLLADHPDVASAPLGGSYGARTPLHAVTDWPGYFPNGPEIVKLLVDAGADPNVRRAGEETPLHWAASSDDWHVAAALIDAGADLNSPDGSIGTPLANAVGYGCWDVARLLVAHGAEVDQAWIAASLGLLDRLAQLLGDNRPRSKCPKRCGTPAVEGNVALPSTCSAAGRTSTGFPTTPKAQPLMPPPEMDPSARTSSDGFASMTPTAPRPTEHPANRVRKDNEPSHDRCLRSAIPRAQSRR